MGRKRGKELVKRTRKGTKVRTDPLRRITRPPPRRPPTEEELMGLIIEAILQDPSAAKLLMASLYNPREYQRKKQWKNREVFKKIQRQYKRK